MACGIVGGKVCPSYKTLIGNHVNFIGNLLKEKSAWTSLRVANRLAAMCVQYVQFCIILIRDNVWGWHSYFKEISEMLRK